MGQNGKWATTVVLSLLLFCGCGGRMNVAQTTGLGLQGKVLNPSLPQASSVNECAGCLRSSPSIPWNTGLDNAAFSAGNNIVYVDGLTYPRTVTGIKAAVVALGSSPGIVVATRGPSGVCYSDSGTDTIQLANSQQRVIGMGLICITVSTSRATPVFTIASGSSSILFQNEVAGFELDGQSPSASQRIAFQAINAGAFYMHDLYTVNWNGATSIGIDFKGIGAHPVLKDVWLDADRPIYVEKNPFAIGGYDFDTADWQNLQLSTEVPTEGAVVFGQGVTATHFTWDHGTCNKGARCIDWRETAAASAISQQIMISDVHHEQATCGAGVFSFDFSRSGAAQPLQDFNLYNVFAAPTCNGFRLQMTRKATLVGVGHLQNGGTALNADGTNTDLLVVNPVFPAAASIRNASTSSTVQQYLANGGALRTSAAASAYFFDLGDVTLRKGDSNDGGTLAFTTNNPAAAGDIRHGKDGADCWRNEAGNGDVCISKNSGDQIVVQNGISIHATNGATWTKGFTSELIPLDNGATTTDSSENLLPANSIINSVVARVTTTITGPCAGWSVGDATTPSRFISNDATVTAGETQVGFNHLQNGVATGAAAAIQKLAAKVRITCTGGNPEAGEVRVTVFYDTFEPPQF